MSNIEYRFLEPLDVLFLRGNKLFGDPGSYGESLVPPWPSVVAGALRSRMLADDGMDLAAFARGKSPHPSLGTPEHPGPFTVTVFHLARRYADGRVEVLIQPPADLIVSEREDGSLAVKTLSSTLLPVGEGLACSAPLPLLPILAEDTRSKPVSGFWLTESGWRKYLRGEPPDPETELVKSGQLWATDPRVGVGLDADTRRAADGRLFSMQAVAMKKREHLPGDGFDVGFLAAVAGAIPPSDGTLRLGGDGRAAAVYTVAAELPEPDYDAIAATRRCRVVLITPGIFPSGWLPTGMSQTTDGTIRFDLHGVCGKLVCAAVPRAEVVSGWDLAAWSQGKGGPKPAQRAAPTGSVYWLEDLDATPEALRKLVEYGLWPNAIENTARRAEGFNRIAITCWRNA